MIFIFYIYLKIFFVKHVLSTLMDYIILYINNIIIKIFKNDLCNIFKNKIDMISEKDKFHVHLTQCNHKCNVYGNERDR